MGMDDTCYSNFVLFTMDKFERHLYIYHINGLKQSPRIYMKVKSISAYIVQGNNFLQENVVHNALGINKKFKFCFAFQDLWKPITACKLYTNCKLYPLLKNILYVFHFEWLISGALYVDEKMIGFKGRHMDKMKISYKNKRGGFLADALCDQGYTYAFS